MSTHQRGSYGLVSALDTDTEVEFKVNSVGIAKLPFLNEAVRAIEQLEAIKKYGSLAGEKDYWENRLRIANNIVAVIEYLSKNPQANEMPPPKSAASPATPA